MQIGNRKVKKIIAGGKIIWEIPDPDTVWYTCKQSLYGTALMSFNASKNIGKLLIIGIPNYIQPGKVLTNITVFQLPDGFKFGPNNPTKLKFTEPSIGSNTPIYSGDLLTVTVSNNDSAYQEAVRLVPDGGLVEHAEFVIFNVMRK